MTTNNHSYRKVSIESFIHISILQNILGHYVINVIKHETLYHIDVDVQICSCFQHKIGAIESNQHLTDKTAKPMNLIFCSYVMS